MRTTVRNAFHAPDIIRQTQTETQVQIKLSRITYILHIARGAK